MYTGLRWYWMVLNGIEWYWTVLHSIWLYWMVWSQISKEILCMKFEFWGWMLQLTNNITLNAVFQRLGNHAYILHLKLGGCLDRQKSIMGLEVLSRELSKKTTTSTVTVKPSRNTPTFRSLSIILLTMWLQGWTTSKSTRLPLLKKS